MEIDKMNATLSKQNEILARHDEKIKNIEDWQEKQNGSLDRLKDNIEQVGRKVDRLSLWLMGFLASVIIMLGFVIRGLIK